MNGQSGSATNTGPPPLADGKQYRLTGLVRSACLGLDEKTLVTTRQTSVEVTFAGFTGDKHAGLTRPADSRTPEYPRGTKIRNDRQVSIVSAEELLEVAVALELPEVRAEWLGANLLLSGVPRLTLLPPNTRLVFSQGAVLVIQKENMPCSGPGKILQKHYGRKGLESEFPKAAIHRRGVVACVERPGVIAEGDLIEVEIPVQTIYKPD